MSERFSCARAARARDEPLHATASTVTRWIMLEQPGPWGRHVLTESRLPDGFGPELASRARAARARAILIRRHGRDDTDGPRRCYIAGTGPAEVWLHRLLLDDPSDLLDIDLAAAVAGETGAHVGDAQAVSHPLYLTCTNGSHDPCCAEFGRPLAAALDRARPEHAWECSHIGGDRFAANLVVMPHGLYFGRVGPEEGIAIAERYERGRIDLEHLRGRSCYPFAVQAAEHFLRRELGADGLDDVRLSAARSPAAGRLEAVFLTASGERHEVELSITPDPEGLLLTCHATGRSCPPRYAVRRLERVGSAEDVRPGRPAE